MGVPALRHRTYATCTQHVDMRAFLYELAYAYKSTAYGDVTAVPIDAVAQTLAVRPTSTCPTCALVLR